MKINCWTIFIIIFSIACSEKSNQNQFGKGKDYPDQESWGVTIILTDSSVERARVKSGHLEKHKEEQYIILDQKVKVDFFDKKQNHVAIMNSAKAEVNQKTNDMKAIGDVAAISDSGITLYTDTLFWNAKKEQMYSRDSVMITTLENDTLYGIGFESDSDLQNWKILRPSGVTNRTAK